MTTLTDNEKTQLRALLAKATGAGFELCQDSVGTLVTIGKGMFWSKELDQAARFLANTAEKEMQVFSNENCLAEDERLPLSKALEYIGAKIQADCQLKIATDGELGTVIQMDFDKASYRLAYKVVEPDFNRKSRLDHIAAWANRAYETRTEENHEKD